MSIYFQALKEVTHQKNLIFRIEDVSKFMRGIAGAAAKKGCVLVQFPPSFQVGALTQLREFLLLLDSFDWLIAVEFRHNSWYKDNVYELLNSLGVSMVILISQKRLRPWSSPLMSWSTCSFMGQAAITKVVTVRVFYPNMRPISGNGRRMVKPSDVILTIPRVTR